MYMLWSNGQLKSNLYICCSKLITFRFLPRGAIQQRLPASFCRKTAPPVYDVFINHRGIDTKWNFARLLYDNLTRMSIRTFLDRMSLKPGDRLPDDIDKAILGCKVGVAVFSPRYCESCSCLHELALFMESKKRLVPIFYDIKPSQLQVRDDGPWPTEEFQRFSLALDKAKNTVGLTFDSLTGYISFSSFMIFSKIFSIKKIIKLCLILKF